MPDPTVSQGHVDQLLTNISVAYMQESGFIADKVFPTVPVQHASDLYWKYTKDAFFRNDVGPRPMGGYAPVTGHGMSTGTYNCAERALAAWIDDRERANTSPPYDIDRAKTRLITGQHMIDRDSQFCTKYMKTGVWTDLTGVSSAPDATHELQWDLSTSLPSKAVRFRKRAVKKATGFEPNTLVLGSKVEIDLMQHPDLIDRVKYTGNALSLDPNDLAQYFDVDKVVVATASQNTADEGQTAAFSFIASERDALLVYAAPEPGLEVPSGGYIFAWTGLLGDNAITPSVAWRGRDERAHSDWIEVRTAYDMNVVGSDLGVYFSGIVSATTD